MGKRIWILAIALAGVLAIIQLAEAAWLPGYTTRKKLTIDHDKIDGDYGSDVLTGGTASADSEYSASYVAAYACDDDTGTRWSSTATALPHYWKYDLGVGVTKTVRKLLVKPYTQQFKDFTFEGSNDDSDWTVIYTGQHPNNTNWEAYTFANAVAYRYYKINCSTAWSGTLTSIYEIEMKEIVEGTLSNLPVLVKLDSGNFDFSKDNDDGFDIRFTESDGSTLLKYERERHTDPNAEYWVKIPSVSSSVDTDFYIYYRTTDTADGADPMNVWDANYKMVQHMSDTTTSTITDSTTNDNDGTKKGADEPIETTTAQILEAQNFDGGNDYIGCGGETFTPPVGAITISAWVKTDDITSREISVWSSSYSSSTYDRGLWIDANSKANFTTYTGGSNTATSTSSLTTGWHYVVGTINTGEGNSIFFDGVKENTDNNGIDGYNSYSTPGFFIGPSRAAYGGAYFDGIIDEVRICNDARTAAEIKADYNSGNDSLLTYGSEQVGPAGVFFGINF